MWVKPASVEITRSIHLPVSYDRPGATREAISEAAGSRPISSQ